MAVLTSQVERDSDVFAARRDRMEQLVGELRERTAQVARGGGEKAVERHRSRGKMTARERVDRLLDPGSAFLELSALAVDAAARGRGLGAALMRHLAALHRAEGAFTFLHVFPENPAAELYARLGFRERARLWVIWRRPRAAS